MITPVISGERKIEYRASSVVSAMIRGGILVLDEGNRMPEKSWASLAPLLDGRRYMDSTIAAIRIQAAPEFRMCVTMNDDSSVYELPGYIQSRLKPKIELVPPPWAIKERIVGLKCTGVEADLLKRISVGRIREDKALEMPPWRTSPGNLALLSEPTRNRSLALAASLHFSACAHTLVTCTIY